MLDLLVKIKNAVSAVLLARTKSDNRKLISSAGMSSEMNNLFRVLKPLATISDRMGGQTYPTLTFVFPILVHLSSNLLFEYSDKLVTAFKQAVRESLGQHFQGDIQLKLMQVAIVLYPRFKNLLFLNAKSRKAAYALVIETFDNLPCRKIT